MDCCCANGEVPGAWRLRDPTDCCMVARDDLFLLFLVTLFSPCLFLSFSLSYLSLSLSNGSSVVEDVVESVSVNEACECAVGAGSRRERKK